MRLGSSSINDPLIIGASNDYAELCDLGNERQIRFCACEVIHDYHQQTRCRLSPAQNVGRHHLLVDDEMLIPFTINRLSRVA